MFSGHSMQLPCCILP